MRPLVHLRGGVSLLSLEGGFLLCLWFPRGLVTSWGETGRVPASCGTHLALAHASPSCRPAPHSVNGPVFCVEAWVEGFMACVHLVSEAKCPAWEHRALAWFVKGDGKQPLFLSFSSEVTSFSDLPTHVRLSGSFSLTMHTLLKKHLKPPR